jgi:putative ABC transport system permease protein
MAFRLPFGRDRNRAEAHDEVTLHIEGRIEELVAAGWERPAAEAEARRRFGDPARVEAEVHAIDVETHRRVAFHEWLDSFARDIRLAARSLARRPTYSVAVILTLALGMGATASIYTILKRVVLNPLPFPDPDRLVRLRNPMPHIGKNTEWDASWAQFFQYQQSPAFEKFALYSRSAANIGTDAEPWRARTASTTVGIFDIIGARAARGRLPVASDDVPGAPAIAVISWNTWKTRFGGDEQIVGRLLRVNETPVEVVGVLAEGIDLPPDRGVVFGARTDIWLLRRLNPAGPFYNNHAYALIGRLKPGTSLAQAQVSIDRLTEQLPAAFPTAYGSVRIGLERFHTAAYPLQPWILGDAGRNLWIAFAAVSLVLVIAGANVANLFLTRLETQRHELAVRAALGAARSDIAVEAFAEGLVLAGTGGALGALLTVATFKWMAVLAPADVPRLDTVSFGWDAALFVTVTALGIAAAFALVAMAHHRQHFTALGEGGRSGTLGARRQRVRGALVATQVALALMLTVGAGLLLRSFGEMRKIDSGVNPRGVLAVEWYLPFQRYDSLHRVWNFDRAALERIRALPGVAAAGAAVNVPLYDGFGCTVQGFEEKAVYDRLRESKLSTCAGQGVATPGFFEAVGTRLVAGRTFVDADNDDPTRGAVIVTKAFAERFWPGESPIGKGTGPNGSNDPPFYHVVGVVDDFRSTALDGPPVLGIYYPIRPITGRSWSANDMRLLVRAKEGVDPMSLFDDVRRAVHEVDPKIPVANAEPMEAALDRSMARVSFTMLLLAVSGIVALVLAAVGIYGVISYLVVRRTNEIGVRIALGAQTSQVESMVVGGALRMAGAGLVVGLAGALLASRVLGGLLYGVTALDPLAYAAAIGVLAAVAAVAGWIPARRAARVSPVEALRRG